MLRIFAIIAPSTAAATSASSNTRNGALPPSSIETRWSWSADWRTSTFPTGVEPVKLTFRSRSSAISVALSALESWVVTMLSTPPGRPASVRTAARASIVSGVSSAGLTIIVHPAATAGPILRVPIASGKFHGVTNRQGPTGLRMVSSRDPPAGACIQRPWMRTASSENQRKNSAPYPTSPLASARVLPISRLISSAKSSAWSMIASNDRRRISPRSRGALAAHSAWAATAASSAAMASSVVPSATSVITESSAGSCTWNLDPLPDSRHCPAMNSPREPVLAKRSSPVMESACHWVEFVESVHVSVVSLTPCERRPGGMYPDDIEPLADPMLRGARPVSREPGCRPRPPTGSRLPVPLESRAGQELFGLHRSPRPGGRSAAQVSRRPGG